MRLPRLKFFILLALVASGLLGGFALQVQAVGEAGNVRGYAWSSNVGWINFKNSSSGTWTTFDKISPSCPAPVVAPNASWGFKQKGDHIFLTDHERFYAYDISTDPSAPALVDHIAYPFGGGGGEGGLQGFAIFGDYAFIAGGQFAFQNFYVIDISDPANLSDPATATISDPRLEKAQNVVISEDGNYAYVYEDLTGDIVVIDISSPTTLTSADILNEFADPDGQKGIAISGDYLYTSGQVHFAVRNLNPLNPLGGGGDPVNPPIVGEITSADPDSDKLILTQNVEVAGDYAYVTSPGQDRITVVNIFDPTNPQVVSWIDDSVALGDVANVSVVDGFAYVSRFVAPSGLQYLTILDVANPEVLTIASTLVMITCWSGGPLGMSEVVVVDDYAYVANWVHGYAIELPHRYATSVERATGWFSGYAWNPGTGWISFNRADTGSPPGPLGDDPCSVSAGGGPCTAKLNIGGNNEVFGWARALSVCPSLPCGALDSDGGWDGWIKFRGLTTLGNPYGVIWDPVTQKLEEWAWGNEVVGWTSFSCLNQGVCGDSDYQVYVYLPDSSPTVTITNPGAALIDTFTVPIRATATDDIDAPGSLVVEYSIDDPGFVTPILMPALPLGGTSYEEDWSIPVADASYLISVRATDSIGNTAVDSITVTVDNIDDPPVVTITNPAPGPVSGTVTIRADATDDRDAPGTLAVVYSIDDPLFAAPTIMLDVPPGGISYEQSWDTTLASEGVHDIYVRATDISGSTDINSVEVTVDNLSPPNPPTALTSSANECSDPASEQLRWVYSHPDGVAITQARFWIELEAGSCDFSSPDVTVGPISSSISEHAVSALSGIAYGTDYCWRVMVEDIRGDVSAWSSSSPLSFTFVAHEYPDPNSFNWSPLFPVVNQVMTFDDCAACDAFDVPASPLASWVWDWFFDDGSFNSPVQDPPHTYLGTGDYDVVLTLVDDLAVLCDATRQVKVIPPFPGWREISPF